MIRLNENYLKLQSSYLFAEISRRVAAFEAENPDRSVIKLGIGDVTRALPATCIKAFHAAVDEMASDGSFRGYGPYEGFEFLREKIAATDFQARNIDINADEIFVSDGAKCDTGNLQELFANDIRVAIPDPVYPVYLDTNVMAGRTGINVDGRYEGVVYLDSTRENGFVADLPTEKVDLIYLCFPNNPTGATITLEQLQKWVDYARENKALIIYDAAYEGFIRDDSIPRSIYEAEGAREVAIETRSLSKTAGFTGTRCAYTVVPKACMAYDQNGARHALHSLWVRRQSTKFNGVSYPVQRAAEAVYSPEGQREIRTLTDYYMVNAARIRTEITALGFACVGGENSPYVWIDTQTDSWSFFDRLLQQAGVVCTPGAGFGKCGEGYVRLSAFNNHEAVQTALARIAEAVR